MRRIDNHPIVVCGDACAAAERAAADAARAERRAAVDAQRLDWATSLQERIAAGGFRSLRVFDEPPAPDAVGRVGGVPLGVAHSRWPRDGGVPALHLCTFPGDRGQDRAAVAVFLMLSRVDGCLDPTGECATVTVEPDDMSTPSAPAGAPVGFLRASTLKATDPPPAWDPTDRAQDARSFIGSEPVAYDGRSLISRFRGGVIDLETLGAFRAQIDGEAFDWLHEADVYREIAGVYLFEHGALLDTYG